MERLIHPEIDLLIALEIVDPGMTNHLGAAEHNRIGQQPDRAAVDRGVRDQAVIKRDPIETAPMAFRSR